MKYWQRMEVFRLSRTCRPKIKRSPSIHLFCLMITFSPQISEFVGGFLAFLNCQPESAQQCYLAYLKLLMERAATYSWYSVRNFHFSINTAVEAGVCLSKSLTRSRIGHKLYSPMPTCLQLRHFLVFQLCLLKRATARKTPIAKSGITQASVTARHPKRHTRAFTVAMFAMQTTQC